MAKSIAQMAVGLAVAKFVTPEDFGLWNTLNLALVYSLFIQAGVINGLNRELPYLLGQDREEEARLMAGTTQTFTFVTSVLVLVAGLCYLLLTNEPDPRIRYGILGITILIALNYYQNYLFSTFRSKSSFLRLSAIHFVHAGVNIATIILVVWFAYYGMVIKAVILALCNVTLMHIFRPIRVGFIWDKAAFLKLVSIGLPIFGLAYLESISSTFDRVLLLNFAGLKEVGIYAFGYYALSSFAIFPASMASYIYPKMTYAYGKTNDALVLWKYVQKITLLLLALLTPLAVIGFFVCPYLVNKFFPEYTESIRVMQILLFAGIFNGAAIGVNVLWSMKAWKYMISYQLLNVVLLICFPLIGLQLFDDKLTGIATGVLSAHVVNWCSAMIFCYIATHRPKNDEDLLEAPELLEDPVDQ